MLSRGLKIWNLVIVIGFPFILAPKALFFSRNSHFTWQRPVATVQPRVVPWESRPILWRSLRFRFDPIACFICYMLAFSIMFRCPFQLKAFVLVIGREGKFSDYHSCQNCTQAGWGWCPRVRRCGGFANKRCSGSETDTERSEEDQAMWIQKRYPHMKEGKSTLLALLA